MRLARRSYSATAWASNDSPLIVLVEPAKVRESPVRWVGPAIYSWLYFTLPKSKPIASHIKKTATDNAAARIECNYPRQPVKLKLTEKNLSCCAVHSPERVFRRQSSNSTDTVTSCNNDSLARPVYTPVSNHLQIRGRCKLGNQ